jgi:methionyl-tRNA formyltransferase
MADRTLATIVCCGDRSRFGRAVLLASLVDRHEVRAVVLPTPARWAKFEARLYGEDRVPAQRSAASRLDPLRRLAARLRPAASVRDPLDVAWGLPDPRELPGLCRRRGAEVILAEDVNDPALVARLAALRPEALLTGAFPQIFRGPLLRASGLPVNIHPSLLPRFRGANPVYWALATGAKETGVTAHLMVARVDAGPILAQQPVPVGEDDDYYSLYGKLVRTVPQVVTAATRAVAGGGRGTPQDETEASTHREPKAADRRLDWTAHSARVLRDRIRAGGAFAFYCGDPLEVTQARLEGGRPHSGSRVPGGTVVGAAPDGPEVVVGGETLVLTHVIFRGLHLDGPSFARQAGLRPGDRFT